MKKTFPINQKKLNIFWVFAFIVISVSSTNAQNNLHYAQPASWVDKIDLPLDSVELEKSTDGYYYLLFDSQYNIAKQASYTQFGIRLDSYESVDEQSTIEIPYNPNYQRLDIHYIEVIRNGVSLNRLKKEDIEFLRTEENRDTKIYTGALTASIHLRDVQTNDIIHYAYTITGRKPLFKDKFSTSLGFQFVVPVEQIYYKIVCPKNRNLNFNYENECTELQKRIIGNDIIYSWNQKKIEALYMEDQVPAWYDPYPTVYISEWESWEELINWAVSIYPLPTYRDLEISRTVSELVMGKDSIEGITAIIRYVQNDIRYLGLEEGDFSHKPRHYKEIYNKRYGDCKEKTHLLRAMLWHYGVESYPVLINSYSGYTLPSFLPDHNAFNHVILAIKWEDKYYYIDPTISNQGGSFRYTDIPKYFNGLMIKKGEDDIHEIPRPDYAKVDVIDKYHIHNPDSTILTVTTTYYGIMADEMRARFANMNTEMISREYLKFYSEFYPDIEQIEDITFANLTHDELSKYMVTEKYLIRNLGIAEEDNPSVKNFTVYAIELNEYLTQIYSTNREMHLGFTNSGEYNQTIIINNYNESIDDYFEKSIEEKYLSYSSSTEINSEYIIGKFNLKFHRHYILPEEYKSYYENLELIQNDLLLNLTVMDEDKLFSSKRIFYLIFIFLCLIVIGLCIVASIMLYRKYDPTPQTYIKKYPNLGGWLILPLIGLFISPIALIYSLFEYIIAIDKDLIYIFISGMYSTKEIIEYGLFIFIDIFLNIFSLIYCILIITLLINKRSSFPKLMIAFYIISVLMSIYEIWALNYLDLSTEAELQSTRTTLSRSVVGAAVWIPYFIFSKRVNGTFVNTYKPIPIEENDEDDERFDDEENIDNSFPIRKEEETENNENQSPKDLDINDYQ